MTTSVAQEIDGLVHRYIERFNAGDFDGASECYRLPFTWLFGSNAVTVSTPEEFLAMMETTKAALVKKGLSHSELLETTVHQLDEHIALVGTKVVRVRTDGTRGGVLAGTYLVHNDDSGWRFVTQFSHPIDAIMPEKTP